MNGYEEPNQTSHATSYDVEKDEEVKNKGDSNKRLLIIIAAVIIVIILILAISLPLALRNKDDCKDFPDLCKKGASNSITVSLSESSLNLRILKDSEIQLFGKDYDGVKPERIENNKQKKLKLKNNNKIKIDGDTNELYIYYVNNKLKNTANMFEGVTTENIDLSTLDLSQVTSTEDMFKESNIPTINMIKSSSLRELAESDKILQNVKSTQSMFEDSTVTTIDLSNWETTNCEDSESTFENSKLITITLPSEKFYIGTDVSSMFKNSSNLANIETKKFHSNGAIKKMNSMFEDCISLEIIELGNNFDTTNVTEMIDVFKGMTELKTVHLDIKLTNVKNFKGMFTDCGSINEIKLGDLKNDNETILGYFLEELFEGCSKEITEDKIQLGITFKNLIDLVQKKLNESGLDLDATKISYEEYHLGDGSSTTEESEESDSGTESDTDSGSDTEE